jgi:hypothetical protein
MRGRVDVATGTASFVCRNSVTQQDGHPSHHVSTSMRTTNCGTGRKDLVCQKMKSKRPVKRAGPRVEMSPKRSSLYA